jgi:hypothetical protein
MAPDFSRAISQRSFGYLPPRISSELRNLCITFSGELALMHGLHRLLDEETRICLAQVRIARTERGGYAAPSPDNYRTDRKVASAKPSAQ